MSTIPADYLPPKEYQPQRIYNLKEFESYPDPLNSTEELLDKQVAAGRGDSEQAVAVERIVAVLEAAMEQVRRLIDHVVPQDAK